MLVIDRRRSNCTDFSMCKLRGLQTPVAAVLEGWLSAANNRLLADHSQPLHCLQIPGRVSIRAERNEL